MTPFELGITIGFLAVFYLAACGFFYVHWVAWRKSTCYYCNRNVRFVSACDHEFIGGFVSMAWPLILWSLWGARLAVIYQDRKKDASALPA